MCCCCSAWRASVSSFLGAGILALLLSGPRARGSDIVTVRAWADPDYVAQRALVDSVPEETLRLSPDEVRAGGAPAA